MTGVTLSQGVVLVLLFAMRGHVRPIGGNGCRGWGSPWLTILPEGYTCPSGEAEVSRGGWARSMTPWGLRRGREMSPEVPILPETSPQGSGRMEFVVRAASDWHVVRAFGEPILLGPYGGALTVVQGVVFYRLLGTLGILIPDSR
jgi:hypothetical protein